MQRLIRIFSILFFCFLLSSCGEDEVYTPKPRTFPRVIYPERSYKQLDINYCQFVFDYPGYARIEQDTAFFDEKPADPCWFDIVIPAFNAKLHCSYFPINGDFEKFRNDAFSLANKHNIKANYIDELPVKKANGLSGMVFNIEGPVASPFQFYLTDSKEHFFRASLYFHTQARPDSLAPVFDFIKEDLMQLINTFEWKKEK